MSNKLKKEIKNKWVKVKGFYHTKYMGPIQKGY